MPNRKKDRDGLSRRKDSPYYWASYVGADGKRVRRSTGVADEKEAKAILAKWKLEVHEHKMWGAEPKRTFEDLMLRYLTETVENGKKSHETDKRITKTLKGFFAGAVLNTLSAAGVNGYIQWRRSSGISDSTINRELGLLSAALNYARKHWEWDLKNPVEGRRPSQGNGRIRWITRSEADRLIDMVSRNPRRIHLREFIELGLNTGMRSQEMLGLTWDRVDLKQRLVYLMPDNNKSARYHSIPLNDSAFAALIRRANFRATHCANSPWVFAKKDGSRIASVKKGFKAACRDAGIEDFTPHDLRHTCAAWLVQNGVSLAEIKELLNHTSVQVTEKYAHLAPENVRSAVSVLDVSHDLVTLTDSGLNSHAK